MALGPITRPPTLQIQPTPARDAGAAQRAAFFHAALTGAKAIEEPAPAAAPAARASAPAPVSDSAQPEPRRGYRPGSLIDLKV
jgi:hypothetical protein